jgi:hypothetical protein
MRANTHTGPELVHAARGLCWRCYSRAEHNDTLADFPRQRRTRDEVVAEWELLRSAGVTRAQAAARIGIKPESLYRALLRAGRAA